MPKLVLDIWHGERGIDLSEWKRRHGLWGVIAKCGGSDDRKWNRYEETTWVEQATQARELGLRIGAYYYSDALTVEDALADAEHCIGKCMRGVHVDMPIYLDIEEPAQLRLSMRQLTDVITTFCGRVRAAGYEVGVYAEYEVFNNVFMDELAGYSLWAAAWRTSWPIWAKDYDLWQEGSIDLAGNRYHRNDDVDGPGHIDLDWASDAFVARIEGGGKKVARKMIDPAEEAAEIHAFMCTDPRFGYNQQPCRWGGDHPAGTVTFTSKAGYTYKLKTGSFDCSSSTITAWRLSLSRTAYAGCLDSATYTADMRRPFVNSGLFTASLTPAKRGDLYLNEGVHVAMCQCGDADNDILSEFNRNENHAASYGAPGDQDGGESVIRGYYNDNWNTVLHYVGGMLEDVTVPQEDPKEETEKGTDMTAFFVKFDGDPTEMFCPDGIHLHAIANMDEKRAIMDFWKLGHPGQSLDPNPKTFGSEDAPWGARYNDVLSRGANFRGFERFNKHPSLRATVTDVVRTELANVESIVRRAIGAAK